MGQEFPGNHLEPQIGGIFFWINELTLNVRPKQLNKYFTTFFLVGFSFPYFLFCEDVLVYILK